MTAITDAYGDAATYRATIGMKDLTKDALILQSLLAISRLIDRKCDRTLSGFSRDASPTARIFEPRGFAAGDPESENPWRGMRGARWLDVDEMATVPTSVIVDANRTGAFVGYTALTNPTDSSGLVGGDYQCLPKNADKGPEAKPWTQLYVPSWSKQNGWWPGCMVQVTTAWGCPVIPAAISQATYQLAGILRIETPRATGSVAEGVDAAVEESPRAMAIIAELLKAYKRERIYS